MFPKEFTNVFYGFRKPRLCGCGSGEFSYDLNDARGIYCCQVCSKCEDEKMSHYRPEIFTNSSYWADEAIEGEDY
jgi:hypothetical protein